MTQFRMCANATSSYSLRPLQRWNRSLTADHSSLKFVDEKEDVDVKTLDETSMSRNQLLIELTDFLTYFSDLAVFSKNSRIKKNNKLLYN